MSEAPDNQIVKAEFVGAAINAAGLPAPALAEVAFVGKSNVGKSSLLNMMMQRNGLVRTSRTPGCTRQINIFHAATKDGLAVQFVDLPGYGFAKLSKAEKRTWGAMLEGYLKTRVTLRAVVVLIDVRRGLEEEDAQMLEFLKAPRDVEANKPLDRIVVATKIDKFALSKRKPELEAMRKRGGVAAIGFSAVTGDGREELWRRIRAAL